MASSSWRPTSKSNVSTPSKDQPRGSTGQTSTSHDHLRHHDDDRDDDDPSPGGSATVTGVPSNQAAASKHSRCQGGTRSKPKQENNNTSSGRTSDSRSCCFGTVTSPTVTSKESSSLDGGSTICTSGSDGSGTSCYCCCCCMPGCALLQPNHARMCRCCVNTTDVLRLASCPADAGCWCLDACRPPAPLCCPVLAAGRSSPPPPAGVQFCCVVDDDRSRQSSCVCRRRQSPPTCCCIALCGQSGQLPGSVTSVRCPVSGCVTSPDCPAVHAGLSRPGSGRMTSLECPVFPGQSCPVSSAMTSPICPALHAGHSRPGSAGMTSPVCAVRRGDVCRCEPVDVGQDVDVSLESESGLNLQLQITTGHPVRPQRLNPCLRVSTPLQTTSIRFSEPLSSTSPVCDNCPAQPDTRDLPTCCTGRASNPAQRRRSANTDDAVTSGSCAAATSLDPPASTSGRKSLGTHSGTPPQSRMRSAEQSKWKNPTTAAADKRRVTPRTGTRSTDTERSGPTVDKTGAASEISSAKPADASTASTSTSTAGATTTTTTVSTTTAGGAGKQDQPARGRLDQQAAVPPPSTDTTPCRDLPHIASDLTHVFAQLASRLTSEATRHRSAESTQQTTAASSPIPRGDELRHLVDAIAGIEQDVRAMAATLTERHLANDASVTHSSSFTVLPGHHQDLAGPAVPVVGGGPGAVGGPATVGGRQVTGVPLLTRAPDVLTSTRPDSTLTDSTSTSPHKHTSDSTAGHLCIHAMVSWHMSRVGESEITFSASPKFHLSQNFLLVGICSSKDKNLRLKSAILREFRGEIEIWSTRNVLCRKFCAVCRKMATSCPSYFFKPRRRWLHVFNQLIVSV